MLCLHTGIIMQVSYPHWPFNFYLSNQNFVATALVTIKAFRRNFRGYKFCTITWARHAPTINDVARCIACTIILKVQGAVLKFLWFFFVIVMLYIQEIKKILHPARPSPLYYSIPWLRYICNYIILIPFLVDASFSSSISFINSCWLTLSLVIVYINPLHVYAWVFLSSYHYSPSTNLKLCG